jgi:Domain of unknown function (DUF4124)
MYRTPFLAVLATLACAVMLAGVAHGQVYKWVDDKGVVNYSSAPPAKGKGAVKLNEDRVTTIPAPEGRGDDSAAVTDPALRRRVDQLERDAAAQRQSAAQQEAAAAEAQRRWVEQCRADRRVDCDDPSRGAYVDPGYGYAYPPAFGGQRPQRPGPAPFTYQPTPHVVQGGGGAVGPYLRPPPGGVVVGPGPYGIGAGYNRASPGGVVLAPGPGGVGAQYVPVPESAAPPQPAPRPRPVPLQR